MGIIPFYVEVGLGNLFVATPYDPVQILRLFRLMRLFKLAAHSRQVRLVGRALHRAREGIYLLGFVYAIGLITFSSLIFYAEGAACYLDRSTDTWIYTSAGGLHAGEKCALYVN